jgi:hypothetical protein
MPQGKDGLRTAQYLNKKLLGQVFPYLTVSSDILLICS